MNTNELVAKAASRLAGKTGVTMLSIGFATPDGRKWSMEPAAGGGFELWELDPRNGPTQHDATEGDAWDLGDAMDYLQAVGAKKAGFRR